MSKPSAAKHSPRQSPGEHHQSEPLVTRAPRPPVRVSPDLVSGAGPHKLPAHMKHSLGAKTLVYPSPVLVVGTYNQAGKPNVMTASWGGVCCSEPPCVAVSLRTATYSHDNLLQRRAFTVNIPSVDFVKQADYFGLVSGRHTDKFAASKLTPVKSKEVDAPFIQEFPLVLECVLVQTNELGMHTQFIGEIMDVKADDSILGSSGAIDIKKLKPLIFTPDTQDYYGIGEFVGKVFSAGKNI